MSELVSKEVFDQFLGSNWPRVFSRMAQDASTEGLTIDELSSFQNCEYGLILTAQEERQMLESMGIIENRLHRRGYINPGMIKDGFHGDPNIYVPRFSGLGKEVIAACEKLYTPEEHVAVNEAVRPELERLIAQTNAELGISE